MSHTHPEKTTQLIDDIIAAGNEATIDPRLPAFLYQFYTHVSQEELLQHSFTHWFAIGQNLFNFMQQRNTGNAKITVYTPSPSTDVRKAYSVIEMVNDDKPFLVDSITAELTRRGLKIYQLIHPIIAVNRDSNGHFVSLADDQSAPTVTESVMYFQITPLTPAEAQQNLEKDLYAILEEVTLAVVDWPSMIATLNETIDYFKEESPLHGDSYAEARNFIGWLGRDNFTFLGSIDRNITATGTEIVATSALGIFKSDNTLPTGIVTELSLNPQHASKQNLIEVGKVNKIAKVHRSTYMDYIAIRIIDSKGTITGERLFIGLFTSVVYYQSATLIPIITRKLDSVIKRSGFSPTSHSGKELVTILEAFPRDELFQLAESELFDICMSILALHIRPKVQLFVRKDNSRHFISCMVFIPRERYSALLSEKIQYMLQTSFNGTVANQYIQVTDITLARLHIIINTDAAADNVDISALEQSLEKITSLWNDYLRHTLVDELGESAGDLLFRNYKDAFPEAYKDKYEADTRTFKDIKQMETALSSQKVMFDIYNIEQDPEVLQLKIYSPSKPILLSDIMPILENMGFDVIDEFTFLISPQISSDVARNIPLGKHASVHVHHFRLTIEDRQHFSLQDTTALIEEALSHIWEGSMQDDGFNKLIALARLSWRQVVYIRALSKYLRQTGFTYSQEYCEEVLSKQPALTKQLVELFYARFDPVRQNDKSAALKIINSIETDLSNVMSSAEDKVIRRFFETSMAIVRTNYFQTVAGHSKDYVSYKFDSSKVPELPLPRPYAEIFVYSPRVEGIHLRGGKVARGGLRWSDRSEDFRTEVLGLMKAQMTKNSVIVPVGSKGGFIVKKASMTDGRDVFMAEGIECYKTFLRGLLDVTDNIIDGKIIPPQNVVRQDEDDPYLVVAADKGTATFSDIANGVSSEYNFWLGDAFASGGSAGYDHKKMAITARGAWISVERHFLEIGINSRNTDFTVVGIGDMSGDVFGNGMLLSKHIRLVGAFNHLHIFIDPNPNPAVSFAERERLFNLPRSNWTDYDQSLLSIGGGIFERKAKSIELSPEIKARFDIEKNSITPDELIRAMLLSSVDLLWNGGIGTYVKASDEKNEEVGDKACDAIRVNGNELRCRIIGEGGNLGCTQRGRIEFALNGGHINTDAIDNSAGVDCSDHEVNIKIALQRAVESGKLTETSRNALLKDMTDEVAALVLRDNTLQTQALTIAEMQGYPALELYVRLMQKLEHEKQLDRKVEFLPSEQEIARRIVAKTGFTRPELAVLLAYSKMTIYNNLLASNLPDDPYFSGDLLFYFPEAMRQTFRDEIEHHPLRREIIATFVTNSMVNRVGSPFFHLALEDTGLKGCDIARAYTITRDIFDLRHLWAEIEQLDGNVPAKVQFELFFEIERLIQRSTFWFMRNSPQPLEISKVVATFEGITELASYLDQVLVGRAKEAYETKLTRYRELGVPNVLAAKIAGLDALSSGCIIVQVAKSCNQPIKTVASIYFEIATRFNLSWLRVRLGWLSADSYWQRLAITTLKDDLYDLQMRLTSEVIGHASNANAVEEWCNQNQKQVERFDAFIADLKTQENVDFAMIVVASKRVESLFPV